MDGKALNIVEFSGQFFIFHNLLHKQFSCGDIIFYIILNENAKGVKYLFVIGLYTLCIIILVPYFAELFDK